MELHLASAWEVVADTVPERDAVVQGSRRITYREFDDAAARFASALEEAGVGVGESVGLFLYNCPEYLVAQYGAFKHRAVPINVNYRYLGDELAYILENSGAVALVFHHSLSGRVEQVRDRLPHLRLLVEVDDGGEPIPEAVGFESLVASAEPQARVDRPGDDLYMLYTGGTTGLPKGVMSHQHEFAEALYQVFGALDGIPMPRALEDVATLVNGLGEAGRTVSVPCCPLMHGTGMWVSAIRALLSGGTVVLLEGRTFDAHEAWSLVERERVTQIVIVGDPFARPLLHALEEREYAGRPYDVSSVRSIASSGAIWSAEVKDGLRSRLSAILYDALGSTEGGGYAASIASSISGAQTAHFALAPGARVVDDNGREVVAGSGTPGLLVAQTMFYGYYNDPERTASAFLTLDGRQYVRTGDYAIVDADGTITLLGRGSVSINTGGEKVFAEEVEEAVKRHPDVVDCLVVGLPDERFGERVVAVVASSSPGLSGEALREWLRPSLAHFKIPKSITVLDGVRRHPNGKADYAWAREMAGNRAAEG